MFVLLEKPSSHDDGWMLSLFVQILGLAANSEYTFLSDLGGPAVDSVLDEEDPRFRVFFGVPQCYLTMVLVVQGIY